MIVSLREIDRLVYVWARYSGTRDATKEGKHYNMAEVQDLIERLKRFKENPESFDEGFEKDTKDENNEKEKLK